MGRSATFLALAALLLLAIPARGGEPSPELKAWIESEMRAWKIPGLGIAVSESYRIEWTAAFGLSDTARGQKVSEDTLFQVASVSKPLSAIATMIALGEHGLSLDEDVNVVFARYSPQADIGAWRLPNPFPTPVTLRMLLSHTGGTSDFRYAGYRYDYRADPPSPIDAIPTLREELLGLPPANTPAIKVIRQPGVTWAYSPAGYTVLQAALMTIYGKSFDRLMDELVLAPVEMTDSTFAQPTLPALTPRIAVPYLPDGRTLPGGPRVFVASASGGLTTTPADLIKLMIAFQSALAGHAQGRLTPEIARAMIVRQPGRLPEGKCFPSSVAGKLACQSSWGLGFDVNLTKGLEHPPDGEPMGDYFGHTGFNSGYLAVLLGSKTGGRGVALTVNVAPEDMSGSVPQFEFMTRLVRRIADEEHWP